MRLNNIGSVCRAAAELWDGILFANITDRLCVFPEHEVYIIIAVHTPSRISLCPAQSLSLLCVPSHLLIKKLFNCSGFRHVQWTLINLIGCKLFTHMKVVSWLQYTQQCTVWQHKSAKRHTDSDFNGAVRMIIYYGNSIDVQGISSSREVLLFLCNWGKVGNSDHNFSSPWLDSLSNSPSTKYWSAAFTDPFFIWCHGYGNVSRRTHTVGLLN